MIIGAFVLGLVLGVMIVVVGVAVYLKRQKTQALRRPESLGLDYSAYHTAPDPEPIRPPSIMEAVRPHLAEPYKWDGGIGIWWEEFPVDGDGEADGPVLRLKHNGTDLRKE